MRKVTLIITIIFFMVTGLSLADEPQSGFSTPEQSVYPEVVNMMTLPPAPVNGNILQPMHKRGQVPDPEVLERVKNMVHPVEKEGPNLSQDINSPIDAISLKYHWTGPSYNGWRPADCDIAVGNLHIMVVTNEQFHIYDRTSSHNLMQTNTFQNFFPSATGLNIFDPKVIYDPWAGRWIFICLSRSGTQSYYRVAVSQSSDPTGSWWTYKFNAHVNGSTTTTLWADYPGLGFTSGTESTGAIVITSNQYNQSDDFQYAKIRVLKRSQLYVGGAAGWWDVWNFTNQDASKAFTTKPAQNWWSGAGANVMLMNTKSSAWDKVTTWRITDPTGSPSLTRTHTINVTSYQAPPNAPMQGGGTVDAFDCRTQDVIYLNGSLFTAYPDAHNWGSGTNCNIRYLKVNESTGAVQEDQGTGLNGFWYIFPDVAPQYNPPFTGDSVGFSFSRSGSTIYPEARVTGYTGTAWISSVQVEAGTGNLGGGTNRFGDYNGIAIDSKQNGHFWSVGDRARSTSWGTGVGYFALSPISPIGIQNEIGSVPKEYNLSQNFPNPFNPVTKISFDLVNATFVKLVVYDLLGREVKTLVSEFVKPGKYEVVFNAAELSSGVYLYKLFTGEFSDTKKMLLSK